MEYKARFRNAATAICLATISGIACADDTALDLELSASPRMYAEQVQSSSLRSSLLPANDEIVAQETTSATPAPPAAQFKSPWLTGRKTHQYLGLGTVLFAGLTMLAAPEDGCEKNCPSQSSPRQTSGTTHTRLARTTAALAAATVMSGLIVHWNDIHWEDPFTDPDKLHARLATAGALLMLYAVDKSAHSSVPTSHSGAAELGAAAMLVAIKLTW